jgi:hypothetical protein
MFLSSISLEKEGDSLGERVIAGKGFADGI